MAPAPKTFSPAINGGEQRLDAILEELRALRAEIAALRPQTPEPPAGTMELREPAKKKARASDA